MAIEIVDLPIKNSDFFHSYVSLPKGNTCGLIVTIGVIHFLTNWNGWFYPHDYIQSKGYKELSSLWSNMAGDKQHWILLVNRFLASQSWHEMWRQNIVVQKQSRIPQSYHHINSNVWWQQKCLNKNMGFRSVEVVSCGDGSKPITYYISYLRE